MAQRAPRRIPSIVWIGGGFLAGVFLGCPMLNRTGDLVLYGLVPALAGTVCGAWFARRSRAGRPAVETRDAGSPTGAIPGWLAAGVFFLFAGPVFAAIFSLATGGWDEPAILATHVKVGLFAGVLGFLGALVTRIVG